MGKIGNVIEILNKFVIFSRSATDFDLTETENEKDKSNKVYEVSHVWDNFFSLL